MSTFPLSTGGLSPAAAYWRSRLLLVLLFGSGLGAWAQAPAVVTLNPARNSRTAARTTNVTITFSQTLNTATQSANTIQLFSSQAGGRKAKTTTISGSTATLNPTVDFRAGEDVSVTVPATVTSSASVAAVKHAYRFTTGVVAALGTFTPAPDATVGTQPEALAMADVDGDGDLDLLAANAADDNVSIRLNNGGGTFTGTGSVAVGDNPLDVATADLDGDGDLDLLTANRSTGSGTTVSVRINNGAGSFAGTGSVTVGAGVSAVTTADVDADGDQDLLTANIGAGGTMSVSFNNGSGAFSGTTTLTLVGTSSTPGDLAVADVDSDGDFDVLIPQPGANGVAICLNNGNGVFTNTTAAAVTNSPTGIAVGDVDGDGDLDFATASFSGNNVSLRLNNGSGSFSGTTNLAVTTGPNSVALSDVDGDGDLDLLTANQGSSTTAGTTVTLRRNDGTGIFAAGVDITVGTSPQNVTMADADSDGDLDILTANRDANTVSVRLNQNVPVITSFTPTSGLGGTSVTITGAFFTGATSVKFNNSSASFTVASATSITATVPGSATSGPITVTTPNGTSQPSATFTIPAPTITSFTPTSAVAGASVTITGTNFTGASSVRFNGTAATFTVSSATSITATVPAGATSGTLSVTTPGGTATSAASFTVIPPPTITSFTPTSAAAGSGVSVTITGTGFTGTTSVKFNALAATFTVVSATSITATLPAAATTGPISVTTPGGTATSTGSFTVVPPPTITSFTPSSGVVGAAVTITGTNFAGATSVKFNGTASTFTVISSTSISTTVPVGATTGLLTVVTQGGTATSTTAFTVLIPVTLTIDSVTATPGAQVVVPVRARDFTGIIGMQGSVTFSTAQLTLVGVEQLNAGLTGLVQANFNTSASGRVSIVYFNSAATGLTLAANAVLFALRFSVPPTASPAATLPVSWDQATSAGHLPLELTKADLTLALLALRNGKVQVPASAALSGTVRTGNGTAVPGVSLALTVTGFPSPSATTTTPAAGTFSFAQGVSTTAYTLAPSKANDVTVTNGVSVTDLILMQRHVLNTQLLGNAARFVSADVNADGALTSADVALVQNFLLGNTTSFPNGVLWRFFSSSQTFANPNAPGTLQATRTFASLTPASGQDFVACKLGDVNDSWNPAISRPAPGGASVALAIGAAQAQPGQRVRVPLTLAAGATLAGLQGTLTWDPTALRLVGAAPALPGLRLSQATATGTVAFVWTDAAGQPHLLPAGTALVWLEFEVTGASGTSTAVQLTSDQAQALAADAALSSLPLTAAPGLVRIGGSMSNSAAASSHSSFIVWPNPAPDGRFRLEWPAGQPASSAGVVLDAVGRIVTTVAPGTEWLDLSDQPAGLYTLRAGEHTVRLMVE